MHCQAGISRSPTVVIAYLMSRTNLEMNEAYNRVKQKRPIIGPNLIFMSQLQEYDINLHSTNKPTKNSVVTPINVMHIPTTNVNSVKSMQPAAATSVPPINTKTTQIEVQHFSRSNCNDKKSNSENNSPDIVVANATSSYYKLSQFSSSSSSSSLSSNVNNNNNNCINNQSSSGENKSILVFN